MATKAQDKPLKIVGETVAGGEDFDAWRPALAAMYRAEGWTQSAEFVERGLPLSISDQVSMRALQAAAEKMPRAA